MTCGLRGQMRSRRSVQVTPLLAKRLSMSVVTGGAPGERDSLFFSMTHHEIHTDLVVVGGGLAGVCASLAAARNGARVVLVQDRSVLGGNASSEIRMHIVGADFHGRRPGTRESGLIEELRLEDAVRNPHRSYSQWDLLLYEKVMAEPNITLLLDTDCVGCSVATVDGRRCITSVEAVRQLTEDRFTLHASLFADCSGDGRLGVEAGADFTVGREAKSDYGESLALDRADRQTLGCSILFMARRYDTPQPFRAPDWVRRFQKHEFKYRMIEGFEYGYWWAEWGGHLDTIKDNATGIRHELLRIALGVWDYVKNSGDHPGSANWALDWVGSIPGKRESRRFLGPHVLTEQDLVGGRVFKDTVAYGGWPLDLHPPTGIDAVDEWPCQHTHLKHLYGIPLRSLMSRNVANLFFAGRNISATHVAFASTRVMATCAVMGQAVGTAAALAASANASALEAFFSPYKVVMLQQRLLRDDVFLPGIGNTDKDDVARLASVSCSGATPGAAAVKVIDGVTRALEPAFGPWADSDSHGWESTTLPAWIELRWEHAVPIGEIHLTFDSGFQRELTLSASDHTTSKVIRGPQPELVRDYEILLDGRVVLTVIDNYLRKRVHRLDQAVSASRLRLVAKATHGLPVARVFEIRAYRG